MSFVRPQLPFQLSNRFVDFVDYFDEDHICIVYQFSIPEIRGERFVFTHDDVIKWKGFPRSLLALCEGNPRVTDVFPSKWTSDVNFDVSLNKRANKQLSRRLFDRRLLYSYMRDFITQQCPNFNGGSTKLSMNITVASQWAR